MLRYVVSIILADVSEVLSLTLDCSSTQEKLLVHCIGKGFAFSGDGHVDGKENTTLGTPRQKV
jgi:hypothetical protein